MAKKVSRLDPRGNRVNVYLDGELGFGLHRAVAFQLAVGDELSVEQVALLKRQDSQEVAFRRAVGLVERRPRSERELRIRMQRQGLPEQEQEAVIGRLREAGLADDQEFARAWIENRMDFRPRGAFALRSELRQKGVSAEVIGLALEAFDEDEAARRATEAGVRKYQHLSLDLFRKRLGAYLSRRGFGYHTVSPLVKAAAAEIEQESEGTQ